MQGLIEKGVDKGAEVAEEKLEVIEGEKYQELAAYLEKNGGTIKDVDLNGDGSLDAGEIASSALKNPFAPWWKDKNFWSIVGALAAAVFGRKKLKEFKDAKKKKAEAAP